MLVTADSRAILTDALKRRLGGDQAGEITEELPCPARLSQPEKSAWLLLDTWASDAPLREEFASHAAYSRDRLRHLLQVLQ